jgi:acyl carrier protein phosphodiesterase
MNYLAHACLSFQLPDILVGNMISDFVKGKKKFDYGLPIQQGIALHRAIDEFTDFHPVTQRAKEFFRPIYRLYSAVFTDVMYDHFLATDKRQFANSDALASFSEETYQVLLSYRDLLPDNFNRMLPYMVKHNWLWNYQYPEGIQRSFEGLVHRAKYLEDSTQAFAIFKDNYAELKSCYEEFFPALKDFAYSRLQLLLKE